MSTANELISSKPGICVPVSSSAADTGGGGAVGEGITVAIGVTVDAGIDA